MAGLADLVVRTETVEIQGETLEVHPLNFDTIGKLLQRFPEFGKLAAGGKLDAASLFSLGPEFIGAFLASGLQRNWSPQVEEIVRELSIDEQIQIFAAILKISMPRGIGPFVKTVEAAATVLGLTNPAASDPAPTDGKPKSGSTRRQR